MVDPESRLSGLLDLPVGEPPPLSELERRARRTRRRRIAVRGAAAAVAALGLVIATVAVWPGEGSQTVSTASGPVDGAGSQPQVAAGPVVLATFDAQRQVVKLLARWGEGGSVCTELVSDNPVPITSSCVSPNATPLDAAILDIAGTRILSGVVAKDLTVVRLGNGGPAVDVLGRGAGFPVNFVGMIVPAEVRDIELIAGTEAQPDRHHVVPPRRPSQTLSAPSTTTAALPGSTVKPPENPAPSVAPTVVASAPTFAPPTTVAPPPGTGEPLRVEVVPNATDLRKHVFQSAAASGSQSVAVQFWGGVSPCEVVGRVDVAESPTSVTITLWTGNGTNGTKIACIELAVYKEVVVPLSAPLGTRTIIDGAA